MEPVSTPKEPRQKILCRLGSLAPAPRQEWLALAHRRSSRLPADRAPTTQHIPGGRCGSALRRRNDPKKTQSYNAGIGSQADLRYATHAPESEEAGQFLAPVDLFGRDGMKPYPHDHQGSRPVKRGSQVKAIEVSMELDCLFVCFR